MFGSNPIRPPVAGDGQRLDVQHIFATLQGEGPLAGVPAAFIRLGGCNLACDFCDTEFESFSSRSLEEIMCQLRTLPPAPLAVITGGEPLRQNVVPLCDALLAAGYAVQIETNGTLWRPLDTRVTVVCSPKASSGRYHRLREDVLQRADALKFIVSQSHPVYRDIPDVGQGEYGIPVFVQPMDEQDPGKNEANRLHAAHLAMQTGARLSLQLHKILGME